VLAAALPVLGSERAAADPIDDQRQRVEELTDQLEVLEETADIQGETYNVALREQQELAGEIEVAETSIAKKETKVGELSDDLAEVAAQAFVSSGSGNLGPLFQSADDHQMATQRNEYSRVALNVGAVTTDDLEAAIDDLDAEREGLEDKKDEAEQLAEQAADAKQLAEESKTEYQQLRRDAESELGRLIQEEEERRAREAYEKMLAERERQAEELRQQQEAEALRAEQERQQQLEEQQAQAAEAQDAEAQTAETEAAEAQAAEAQAAEAQDAEAQAAEAQDAEAQTAETEDAEAQTAETEAAEAQNAANDESSSVDSPPPPPVVADSSDDSGGSDTSGDDDGSDDRVAPQPYNPPPPPAPPPPVANGPSSKAQIAINAAMSELGTPWVFAMAQPGVGFDCSGLTSWAWAKAGVSMPHQSAQQYASLPHVPVSQAQPGDLLFYYSPISHVGIYLGNGQLVHSPNSTTTVKVASVSWENVVGAARPG